MSNNNDKSKSVIMDEVGKYDVRVFAHNKFILTIGWEYLKLFLKEMMNSDLDDDRMLTLKGKDHLYILNDNY